MQELRVLIISQDNKIKDSLRTACADMGMFQVNESESAKIGWKSLVLGNAVRRPFDVVFCDRDDRESVELYHQCQANQTFSQVKFVFLLPEACSEPFIDNEAEPCTYLVSPVSFNKVRNRLKRLKFSVPKYKVA